MTAHEISNSYEGNTDNGTLFRFNSTASNINEADFRMNGVFAETNNQIFGVNGDTFNILNASVTNSELYAGVSEDGRNNV